MPRLRGGHEGRPRMTKSEELPGIFPAAQARFIEPAHDARLGAAGLAVWVEVNGQQRAALTNAGEGS